MTRCNVMSIAANHLKEHDGRANPFLLPGVGVKTTPSDHFPISEGQLISWSGTRWVPKGSVLDGSPKIDD